MPRQPRYAPGGLVYHALNRATARQSLFETPSDYLAFEGVLKEALVKHPIRLLSYCVMPTHWHFVLWPERDGQLTDFLRWLTLTHTQRLHAHRRTVGTGHLYQGRFKSFPIEEDDHLLTVLRYVERNPLRAGLVDRSQDWPYGSLAHRLARDEFARVHLHAWPVEKPKSYVRWVNRPQTEAEEAAVGESITRGRPFGSASWQAQTAAKLNLEFTLRQRGRPKKVVPDAEA